MSGSRGQITSLLSAAGNGDAAAAEQLWRAVYDELHRVAQTRMAREGRRPDLQTTVLVQEAYLRLVGRDGVGAAGLANRRHFFAAAVNAMRQFLIDDARRRGRKKGGGRTPGVLGAGVRAGEPGELGLLGACDPAELLALDEALVKLRAHDDRKAEIVALRYFAGLTLEETAEVLGLSVRQVDQEWRFAKAWLHRELA